MREEVASSPQGLGLEILAKHKVSDFVRHGAIAVKPDEPLWNALKAMVTHGIHGAAVMEDSKIVGAFEEDDLLRALRALEEDALAAEVKRFMKPAVVVKSSDTFQNAMVEMLKGNTTRAFVRSSGLLRSGVYGVISASDIVRVLTGDYRGFRAPGNTDRPVSPPKVGDIFWPGSVAIKQVIRNSPLTLDASSSVADVARCISEKGRHYAVLLEGESPIGRAGDKDVMGAALDAILNRRDLHDLTARNYLQEMVVVPPETPLHEALWEVIDKMSDRIYVMDGRKLTGVVPLIDAVYTLAKVASD
ncbi:CBS domain-containing protein [Methanopyrus kandleri]|uniref:CBS-domain-containing protein n=2 Tax=Methanopyrus kandleri TaxID=2320 RepID=Q8TX96_METKA|nr:CBS domain-containing protein [Methanopyrus kandleri]AAM01993.1 CBS-domain-containing protein [Methanopyrus kandleri AV19]HII69993.1 CBS domain-containing protein [Methanopyrus kandleri]